MTKNNKHTVVISLRVASGSKAILEKDVAEIAASLRLRRKFTLSDYLAILISHSRQSTKADLLSRNITITDI